MLIQIERIIILTWQMEIKKEKIMMMMIFMEKLTEIIYLEVKIMLILIEKIIILTWQMEIKKGKIMMMIFMEK